ncbi:S-adenosyl-L-methionine-dependent methyltransferase [Syncephalastrum racemosum]|uniref:S-adenosyl-L-methionine-dependent methyltransferase n=1 Tax=Syncephalastrum racemosum TaxID=13706 RepID=A0A1X2HNK8_SYNRA|nr:S-adenosyl-L-methionine-dependent methyltransferase [Syncephalastrum racemosum]
MSLTLETPAQARPSYPAEAIDFIQTLVPQGAKVLDLAAGTGIMTALLVNKGLDVVAVEPVDEMRAKLSADLPAARALKGTSWEIPVPDGSQEAVIVAQAFHWFDDIKSLREIHRVLKPNGYLILIWNMESRSSPWVAKLRDVYELYDGNAPQYRKGKWKDVFEIPETAELYRVPIQHQWFKNETLATKDKVMKRVFSKSYMAILPEETKKSVADKMETILVPDNGFITNDQGFVRYPHDTEVAYIQKI